MFIAVNVIESNPYQPRTNFDVERIEALAQTMSESGLINPISVSGPYPNGRYMLHDGERRLMAAKLLGWSEIEASIKPPDESSLNFALLGLIANLQREDMGPIDEANAYYKLREMGLSFDEIAQRVGVSSSNIRSRIRMLELCPDVQELFNLGKLPLHENVFTQLRRLEPEIQTKVARRAAAFGLTAAQIIAQCTRLMNLNPRKHVRKPSPENAALRAAPALFLNQELSDHSADEIRVAVQAECKSCGMCDDLKLCQSCPLSNFVARLAATITVTALVSDGRA